MERSYSVIFDVIRNPPPNILGVLVVGILLTIIGLVPFAIKKYRATRVTLGIQMLVAGLGLSLLVGPIITQHQFHEFVRAYREGRYAVVEGVVQDFSPMPSNYRTSESFTVGGRRFTYNDFRMTPGFHQSRASGGPMRAGITVRIHYMGDDIARLEIAE